MEVELTKQQKEEAEAFRESKPKLKKMQEEAKEETGVDKEKESQADKLVYAAFDSCKEFFCDETGRAFAAIQKNDSLMVYAIRSREFKTWLAKSFYDSEGKTPNVVAMNSALSVIEGEALFNDKKHELKNRVAYSNGKIYYDLGNKEWEMVEISRKEWKIVPHNEVIFRRYPHHLPQVKPANNSGDYKIILKHLRPAIKADDEILMLSTIATFLISSIPHVIPNLYGAQGSAKTTVFKIIKRLIDPSSLKVLSFPDEKRELVQFIAHHYLAFFDNISHLSDWQSDILSRAATGEGFSKRELFSDDEDIIYNYLRCVGLNGINIPAIRPDLLDRSLLIRLERISKIERKKESEIWAKFEEDMPKILGGLFDVLVKALNIFPTVEKELKQLPRMADYCCWGEAIARAIDYEPMAFYNSYMEKIGRQNLEAIAGNIVGDLVIEFMKDKKEWLDTPSKLLEQFEILAQDLKIDTRRKNFPKAPHALTRKLNEIKANLQDIAILVEDGHDGKRRYIKICKDITSIGKSVNSVNSVNLPFNSANATNDINANLKSSIKEEKLQVEGHMPQWKEKWLKENPTSDVEPIKSERKKQK